MTHLHLHPLRLSSLLSGSLRVMNAFLVFSGKYLLSLGVLAEKPSSEAGGKLADGSQVLVRRAADVFPMRVESIVSTEDFVDGAAN